MAWAAAAMAVVGAVQASKGAKAQAKGQAAAHKYNQAVANRNAAASDIQAENIELVGQIESREQQRRFLDLQKSVTVAYAKSGVDPSSGTARLVALENARQFDEEQAARNMGIEADAQGEREKGVNARLAGQLQGIYARNAIVAGKYKSDQALLAGATQAAGSLQSAGAFA